MIKLSGIVLAAGDSKRIDKPKAVLEYFGKTFIEIICSNLKAAGIREIIAVLGRHVGEITSVWKPSAEKVVINKNPESGQISSFRCGLETVELSTEGYMVCLVDMPMIKPETYKQIINFWTANKDCIVIPKCKVEVRGQRSEVREKPVTSCEQRVLQPSSPQVFQFSKSSFKHGHPIIISAVYRSLCFEGPLEKGLHWVTHHESVKALDLLVEDENILKDIDTAEDYQNIYGILQKN